VRGSDLLRPVAKDALEQFPAGAFGDAVDKLDSTQELHVLGFIHLEFQPRRHRPHLGAAADDFLVLRG